jgi:anti-anti-sigma factor
MQRAIPRLASVQVALAMAYLKCPECGLTLKRHPLLAAVDDLCPRCRASGRSPVALAVIALACGRGRGDERRRGGRSAAASDHGQLTLRTEHLGGVSTVMLWGELDVASAAVLEAEVMIAEQLGARNITIDLSGLDFLDTSGLQAILGAHARCLRHGRELTLLRGPSQVQRIFELTHTSRSLAFLD